LHEESEKFELIGNPEINSQALFSADDQKDPKIMQRVRHIEYAEQNKTRWFNEFRPDSPWLFERNYEIHQVVKFIQSK